MDARCKEQFAMVSRLFPPDKQKESRLLISMANTAYHGMKNRKATKWICSTNTTSFPSAPSRTWKPQRRRGALHNSKSKKASSRNGINQSRMDGHSRSCRFGKQNFKGTICKGGKLRPFCFMVYTVHTANIHRL